jgi:tetratricopeptide (TPR) repeat protein
VGDRSGKAKALNNLGSIFQQQNQTDRAIEFYQKSVNVYETLRSKTKSLPQKEQELYTKTISGTYRTLAELLTQQGRRKEAQQVIKLLTS